MYSVRFADEPKASGYNRNGFTSLATARDWAIGYLREQNAIPGNPFDPTLLVVASSDGEVLDTLRRWDTCVEGRA